MSVFAGATAIVAAQAPVEPGPQNGPPDNVNNFTDTVPITENHTVNNSSSLAGKMRVEEQYADNITVEIARNSSTNYSLLISSSNENATNVSFYLQEEAMENSQNIENITMKVDGEAQTFGKSDESGSPWVSFNIDHFSTRSVEFSADGGGGSGGVVDTVTNNLLISGVAVLLLVVVLGGLGYRRFYSTAAAEATYLN